MTDSQEATTDGSVPASSPSAPVLPVFRWGRLVEMHPVVFPASALIVLVLILGTLFFPSEDVQGALEGLRDWVGDRFGWLYVLSMTGFLILSVWLAFGRYGRIKLGKDEDVPRFGKLSWFAMLFSAGMGIGLMFWSVAEPIYHFTDPPPGFASGLDPSRVSMAVTIFHWGLHPWGLYAVLGLALAYFGYRRDMPLSLRSLLHPLLGDRVWGRLGDVVDTLAIIATLTGVATSLGIGAKQVNAGLAFLFGVPIGVRVQVLLIACITLIATVSVVLGLARGIRRLSEINIALASILMLLVILGSGVIAFLGSTVENIGSYLQLLPFNSLRTGAIDTTDRAWLNTWTVFYWAWWISWSPFVGMFIARVSRGRTIREFVTGVLLVPTVVGILWLTAFGTTSLRQHVQHLETIDAVGPERSVEDLPIYRIGVTDEDGNLAVLDDGSFATVPQPMTAVDYLGAPVILTNDGVDEIDTLPTVLFVLLEGVLAWGWLVTIAAGIATMCIVLFFVTSSDSASMVIDIIASGGNPNPPVLTRLFWALLEGAAAAVLLLAGGLSALQAASITAALPFTLILILGCCGLVRALSQDPSVTRSPKKSARRI